MFPARTTLPHRKQHACQATCSPGTLSTSVDAKPPRQPTKVLMSMMIVVVASGGRDHNTGLFVEQQLAWAAFVAIVEVEHVVERSGDGIERAAMLNALAGQPVVLDEPQHRGLVGQGVIDMVTFRKGRHHQ